MSYICPFYIKILLQIIYIVRFTTILIGVYKCLKNSDQMTNT